jgi:hypothetical protein
LIPPRFSLLPAAALATSGLFLGVGAASAQVLQAPRRAAEVTTPRTTDSPLVTTMLLNASAFGGYDDNVSVGGDFGGEPGAPPLTTASGYVGQFNGGFQYRRGKGRNNLDFGVQGSSTVYGDIDVGPTNTAGVTFGSHSGLGRSNMLHLTQAFTYDSTYALDALGPVEDVVTTPGELPTGGAVDGLLSQASWASQTGVSLDRQWSRRDSTSIGYDYSYRSFTGSNGETSKGHGANASYTRQLTRVASMSANYAFSNSDYAGSFTEGPRRPVDSHNIEGSAAFTKRVSPRRSLYFGFGGGASRVETVSTEALVPYQYWAPVANADARLDLSMTWTLAGNYRRTTTGFEGISRETFVSNVTSVSVGGPVGSRLHLVFSGGGANGNVEASAAGTGRYNTATVAAQAGVALTRTLSATVQYSYYRYNFSEDTALAGDLPPEFSRNSVHVGLTLAMPLGRQASRAARP